MLDNTLRTEMLCPGGRAKVQVTLTPIDFKTTQYESLLIGLTEDEPRTFVLKNEQMPVERAVELRNRWALLN